MLDEMKEKFEDSFTDEEKIQIFNLIFSGYYSLSYIKFLAQKKAGRDLGIEVKEPQNLLPPEGEGADYDDYLDAILSQPNKNSVLENPNKPEIESDDKKVDSQEEIQSDVKIEMPTFPEVVSENKEDNSSDRGEEEEKEVEVNNINTSSDDNNEEESDNSSSGDIDNTISESPIQESMLSGDLPGAMGPDSSLGKADDSEDDKEENSNDENVVPEGFVPTKVDDTPNKDTPVADNKTEKDESEDIKEQEVEEKEPLTPTISTDNEKNSEENKEEKKEDNVITFGFGDNGVGEAHEPTIEVIQVDTRPKKEEVEGSGIKIVAPTEGGTTDGMESTSNETLVLPTASPESTSLSAASETAVTQPSQEVPTVSLADLQNPQTTNTSTQ